MSLIERLSNTKKKLILAAASTVLLILIVAILEVLTYYWLKMNVPKHQGQMSMQEFILSKPLPFANADDYEEVRREWAGETDCPKNRIINDSVTGFPRHEMSNVDCNGPVTMKNGLRTTTGAVTDARNRIMFFGGSTMWGAGSADRNTIPSLVQKILAGNTRDYGIYNHGFASVVIAQQVKLLKSIPVHKDDVVVFYDGGNDVWNSVVYGNPEGGIIGYNDANFVRMLINRLKFWLSSYSNTYQALGQLKNTDSSSSPCLVINDALIDARAAKGFEVYRKSIMEAKRYVKGAGGYFFHFLQPSLVSSPPMSPYEEQLIAAMADETKCGIDAFAKGYQLYKKWYAPIRNEMSGTDLSESLETGRLGNEYFWDYIHVSSSGNKVVAGRIYDVIRAKIH